MTATQKLSIDARPGPYAMDPRQTAVIVVDMQNDFASEGGMMAAAGIDIAPIQATIEPTARVLAAARQAGSHVVYLKMEFRPDLSDLGDDDSVNAIKHRMFGVGQSIEAPNGSKGRFLIRDTWNTAIIEGLAPESADVVVSKHRFSGFFATDLDTILRTLGVKNLAFTGCTTSICVESTLRDAFFRDYRCILLEDCVAEPIGANLVRTNHDATVLAVESLFGWVSDAASFVQAVAPPEAVPVTV